MFQQLTDVVKNLIIINVLVYIAAQTLNLNLALFPPGSGYFEPYQIVSHMFMHDRGGLGHILFNMIGLYFFGPPLEYRLGPKRFLILYFVAGFGSMTLHLLTTYAPMVGASGAIMGVVVGYAMKYPNNVVQLIFPPIALKAKYMAAAFIAMDLFSGIGNYNTGVAHFAHLGGALAGFLLIKYWERFGKEV